MHIKNIIAPTTTHIKLRRGRANIISRSEVNANIAITQQVMQKAIKANINGCILLKCSLIFLNIIVLIQFISMPHRVMH